MKKQYVPPTMKVVAVKMELGFNISAFQRDIDLFQLQSIDGEFRADHFDYDDWNNSSPSPNDGQFNYNDWGKI